MIRRLAKATGSFCPPPDLDLCAAQILVAALARGRSELSPFPSGGAYSRMAALLNDLGIPTTLTANGLSLEGQGLTLVPHLENVRNWSEWPLLDSYIVAWLAWHYPQGSLRAPESVCSAVAARLPQWNIRFVEGELVWSKPTTWVKPSTLEERDGALLYAVLGAQAWEWHENSVPRDHFLLALQQAQADLQIEKTGLDLDDLDEVQRRMLRKKGIKAERKLSWHFTPSATVLKPLKSKLGGDLVVASAWAWAALSVPGSSVDLTEVCANPSRAGWVANLRKLGAQMEWVHKKERGGEATATLRIKGTRQWQGRKLTGDACRSLGAELALLLSACAYIPEETIVRDLPQWAITESPWMHSLIEGLRQGGAEIGVYEEGLVIHGRETLDSATWDALGDPGLSIHYALLAARAHGIAEITQAVDPEYWWPGFWLGIQGASHEPG